QTTVGPRCGASHGQPFFVDFERAFGVHVQISVVIPCMGALDTHPLMPTMHAADGVGVYGEGDVLVHAAVAPIDALAVGVAAVERFYAFQGAHAPAVLAFPLDGHRVAAPAVALLILWASPAAQVMGTGYHPRFHPLRHPYFIYKITD